MSSSMPLDYSIEKQIIFNQEVKEAVKLAREMGLGQQGRLKVKFASEPFADLRILLNDGDKTWG